MHHLFEFLNGKQNLVTTLLFIFAILNVAFFFILGRKAESQFSSLDFSTTTFREKGASGYSKKSLLTRLGGASKVLDVIITDSEFCIKGINGVFTYIGEKHDLTRRMPISNIKSGTKNGADVEVSFHEGSNLVLRLKDTSGFIKAVQD